MKKTAMRAAVILLVVCCLSVNADAARVLVPGGQLIGLKLENNTVTVAAFDLTMAAGRSSGLQIGDEIVSIDSQKIHSAADVRSALDRSGGQVELVVRRKAKTQTLTVRPEITRGGPMLGVYLREGITGIGTVTWYDPETRCFGTLGHGVHAADGQLLELVRGSVYSAAVVSVTAGRVGAPGQLRGSLTAREPIGTLSRNTERGAFGQASAPWAGTALPVARSSEIRTGEAGILCSVSRDGVREYSVEILKVYPQSTQTGRSMLLRITDPDLLSITGGIVQGMSGSPIIQDGKLVGAVTHVLVNDPTTGYGIFIENMLESAG